MFTPVTLVTLVTRLLHCRCSQLPVLWSESSHVRLLMLHAPDLPRALAAGTSSAVMAGLDSMPDTDVFDHLRAGGKGYVLASSRGQRRSSVVAGCRIQHGAPGTATDPLMHFGSRCSP